MDRGTIPLSRSFHYPGQPSHDASEKELTHALTNWSLSKLGTFQKCRRKFLYSYIQNLPGNPQADRTAADRGVVIHKAIEDYFKRQSDTLPDYLRHYAQWFDRLRDLDHYSENQLAMRSGWLPCAWEDPQAWWKGVLDLKVLARPKAWVFDWKTGKVYPDHVDQKELYTIATFVEHEDIDEVEAWHIYVDLKGKDTKVIYKRDQLPLLIAKWNGKLAPYMQALERYVPEEAEMMFVTNPSYLCDYCKFQKNPCPH